MFEDSLFASTASRNRRRGWAAVLSFAFQAVVLGIFVLVPLLYTDALPLSALKGTFVVTAPVRASAPPAPEVHRTHPSTSNFVNDQLVQPIQIPVNTTRIVDTRPVDTGGDIAGPTIPGAIYDPSARSDTISRLIAATNIPKPPANVAPSRIVVRSTVTEGMLLHRVTPEYPPLARQARIQGQVLLQATISRDGTIENLQVITGHPMLVKSAIDAVRQWRYRPYLLNNQPVEVETQITVNFNLGG